MNWNVLPKLLRAKIIMTQPAVVVVVVSAAVPWHGSLVARNRKLE